MWISPDPHLSTLSPVLRTKILYVRYSKESGYNLKDTRNQPLSQILGSTYAEGSLKLPFAE